ncbi:hypothetical protein AAMO2058_000440700 [Amorphochlora amoebiformis]
MVGRIGGLLSFALVLTAHPFLKTGNSINLRQSRSSLGRIAGLRRGLESLKTRAKTSAGQSGVPLGRSDMADIPTIDMADIDLDGLKTACKDIGFLAIQNHGIDLHLANRVLKASTHFFDKDFKLKSELVVGDMQRSRGYEMSPEHVAYMNVGHPEVQDSQGYEPSSRAGIVNERFCIGPKYCPDKFRYTREKELFYPDNVFPADDTELQALSEELYSQMTNASRRILQALALCLGEPHLRFCPDNCTTHCSNMQIANYPSQLWEDFNRPLRVKAHADSGTITLLIRQKTSEVTPTGGLQILSKDGRWLRAPPLEEGAILVNIGNLLTVWTGGSFQSTKHRVSNPVWGENSRRLSIAYFQKPSPDTWIYSTGSSEREGVRARDLMRVGILDKLISEKGMTNEEARHEYHRMMKSPYILGSDSL